MAGMFAPFEPHGGGGPRLREIPLRMLVPNMVTIVAICAGLSGIRLAFEGRVELAVVMVLFAAFLDGVDGRLARMLKASSKFGEQLDSLADIVNFGVAPALVLYAFLLDQAGSFGWIAALIYAIACGLRLARFNVAAQDAERPAWQADYFVGVPAPAGAALVMLPAYLCFLGAPRDHTMAMGAALFTIAVAFLLISRLPVFSGKSSGSHIRREAVMPLLLAVVAYVLMLASFTWQTVTVSVLIYMVFLVFSARAYTRRAAKEAPDVETVVDEVPSSAKSSALEPDDVK